MAHLCYAPNINLMLHADWLRQWVPTPERWSGAFASRTRDEEPSRSDASADPAPALDGHLRRRRSRYCAPLLSGRKGIRFAVSPPTGSRCPGVSAVASVQIEREAHARTAPDPQNRLAC